MVPTNKVISLREEVGWTPQEGPAWAAACSALGSWRTADGRGASPSTVCQLSRVTVKPICILEQQPPCPVARVDPVLELM